MICDTSGSHVQKFVFASHKCLVFNYKYCFDWPLHLTVQIGHPEVKIDTFRFLGNETKKEVFS